MLEAAGVDGGASGEVAMAKKTQEMVIRGKKLGYHTAKQLFRWWFFPTHLQNMLEKN